MSSLPSNLLTLPLFDVRSPGEFAAGHIPGAHSLPLFSDAQRAEVGTLYKQQGAQIAWDRGLELVGPRLIELVREVRQLMQGHDSPLVRVMCWRGGMRSRSVAWLLQQAGFQVEILPGGYRSWRRALLKLFAHPWNWRIFGGPTGSGKTALLHALHAQGAQVLDLEALASHRGSAFGDIGLPKQHSQEHFENLIGAQLLQMDSARPLCVEDESRMIGVLKIPDPLFHGLQQAPMMVLDVPKAVRIQRLVEEYGTLPKESLVEAVHKLRKRLGIEECLHCADAIQQGRLEEAVERLLHYYDKTYEHSLHKQTGPSERCSWDHTDLSIDLFLRWIDAATLPAEQEVHLLV